MGPSILVNEFYCTLAARDRVGRIANGSSILTTIDVVALDA